MSLLRNTTSGLRSLFRKEQVDRELDEEPGAYLEMEAAEKIKQGMNRNDALRAVRLFYMCCSTYCLSWVQTADSISRQ
jgi:hypothetical protein